MSQAPIFPISLCVLLKLFGLGDFSNLIKESMINTIQINEVVIDKNALLG